MRKIRQPLADKIIENSVSKYLTSAIAEWQIISKIHNEIDGSIRCLCGQPGIKDWYELENIKNGKILIHIGANCIEYFTAATDFLPAQDLKKLGHLKRQAKDNETPKFTKSHFPKTLINYLWENDVFIERLENQFHAYNDYKRFAELVYKGGKNENHSPSEYDELITLWTNFIKPFLLGQPREKFHIQTLEHSKYAYQKRIAELEIEIVTLKQELAKYQPQNIEPANHTKMEREVPIRHQELITLCRKRKNRRNLRFDDLDDTVIYYWQTCSIISTDEAKILIKCRQHKGNGLSYQIHLSGQAILERLTTKFRKREK